MNFDRTILIKFIVDMLYSPYQLLTLVVDRRKMLHAAVGGAGVSVELL